MNHAKCCEKPIFDRLQRNLSRQEVGSCVSSDEGYKELIQFADLIRFTSVQRRFMETRHMWESTTTHWLTISLALPKFSWHGGDESQFALNHGRFLMR